MRAAQGSRSTVIKFAGSEEYRETPSTFSTSYDENSLTTAAGASVFVCRSSASNAQVYRTALLRLLPSVSGAGLSWPIRIARVLRSTKKRRLDDQRATHGNPCVSRTLLENFTRYGSGYGPYAELGLVVGNHATQEVLG